MYITIFALPREPIIRILLATMSLNNLSLIYRSHAEYSNLFQIAFHCLRDTLTLSFQNIPVKMLDFTSSWPFLLFGFSQNRKERRLTNANVA